MSYQEKWFKAPNGHTIVFNDWGNEANPALLCVHGLTGNGHDFDYLAEKLIAKSHRIIAVDLAGRGRSNFLEDTSLYNYDVYTEDLLALIDHLKLKSVNWLGVSLGGLLGMRIAGDRPHLIDKLIINDVGPTVPQDALDFIYEVVKQHYEFSDTEEFEQRLRETRGKSWGPVTDAQWKHMAKYNARKIAGGKLTYAYDQKISEVFKTSPIGDIDLWQNWARIQCPTLLIQGSESLLLTNDIIDQMRATDTDFTLKIFEGCGHVPSLMAHDQIETVLTWLNGI